VVNEDLPEILNLEGPNPLVLDAGSGIFDGLSDPDESPDDAKIVDASDLQQFASALQEAQHRTVEVEREIAKGKQKTPKMYRRNSKKTLSCCEKTRKDLASCGFHDVFSFLAMKEKERASRGGILEENKPADRSSTGGGGGAGEEEYGAAANDRERYSVHIGTEHVADGPRSPISCPLDEGQSQPSGDLVGHTFDEEEESSGEEQTPSFLHRTRYRIADADECASESGGISSDTEPLESRSRKGKERHWAAEEEEESSDENSKLVGVSWYKEASCKDSTSEAHPGPAGSCAGVENRDDGDSAGERGGDSPGPAPSQTPTAVSGHSSDFGLESEGVSSALEDADKPHKGWKDRKALATALPKLVGKSCNTKLDLILCARLTGMIGVLNLYLDPKLQSSWTNASMVVAKVEARGVKRARNLCEWILRFVQSGELPVHHLGQSRWNILDDEDLSQSLQTLLLSHTKGHYITASDVVKLVSGPIMQEKFTQSGISRTSISEHTARHWLQRLSWRYGAMHNGMYLDGHEHDDVVAYRAGFVARWKEYEKRFHTWDSNDVEHLPQNAFPVQGGRFRLILVTHDESVFYQNDSHKTHWIANTSKATPLPKGDGQSIMVSDFLTAEWGRLCDYNPEENILESVLILFLRWPMFY
jgi:hypothetical protein